MKKITIMILAVFAALAITSCDVKANEESTVEAVAYSNEITSILCDTARGMQPWTTYRWYENGSFKTELTFKGFERF